MRCCELKNSLAVEGGEPVVDHENRVRHIAIHCRERLVEILGLAHAQRLHGDTHLLGASLSRAITQCHTRVGCIHSAATRRNAGAISFRSSSRLGVISADTSEVPVTWPP